MQFHLNSMKFARKLLPAFAVAGLLVLAGCATSQPSNGYGNRGTYGTTYGNGNGTTPTCQQCGTVQSVDRIYVDNADSSHMLGTIIGAVVGGALGNQVGKGDGRKAATVAGAVAGGAVGNAVASHDVAYRVVVRLDDGRMATVTQRGNPSVNRGDRVRVAGNQVVALR